MFGRATVLGLAAVLVQAARADDVAGPPWAIHGQATFVWQYHPAFRAAYSGPNSLDADAQSKETFDATVYLGVRPWTGAEIWINPEVDQGFGLSNTLGLAGFASGEAYKVGKASPYFRLQRAFFRQTFELGGESEAIEAAANQFGGRRATDTVVVTIGKFAVTDVFDTNAHSHDPRTDFFNWALIDSGAYDYAADAWGYSYGIAAEWTQSWWTLRLGAFDLPKVPNGSELETGFQQFGIVGEVEERHSWAGRPGKLKLLGFVNRGRMAAYDEAVAYGRAIGGPADAAAVRRTRSRPGGVLNLEQQLTDSLGLFVRLSKNDGRKEAFAFTEINASAAGGLSLAGTAWNRPGDTVGLGVAVNGLSASAQRYFAAGGLGILIGDGRLDRAGAETILESYYKASLVAGVALSLDYQWIRHPAYNRDRGPVSIFGVRVHGAF
jgi:high affinity Mn2+ porin